MNDYILDNSPTDEDNYAKLDMYDGLLVDMHNQFSRLHHMGWNMTDVNQLLSRVKGNNDTYTMYFIKNMVVNNYCSACGFYICIGNCIVEDIHTNCNILKRAKFTYYCLKFKHKFRSWLWEKVRKPKIEAKYHPKNMEKLIANYNLDDDLLLMW